MIRTLVRAAAGLLLASAATAETVKPSSEDAAAVRSCLESDRGKELGGERCIGVVADPCLDRASSTADMNICADREFRVWDAMLNEAYGGLRAKLDAKQQTKLRDMQRAWIASRDKTCEFYWDFHQGTIASPMASYCRVRETARRVMLLRRFLDEN